MRRSLLLSTLAAVFPVVSSGLSTAQPPAPDVPYQLREDSQVEIGCQGACACPIFIRGFLTGNYILTRTGSDGLFDTYDVSAVDWSVTPGDPPLRYTGSGAYRVGGEFAVQHQMTLDLTVNGQFQQRFDSGLVPGGQSFPDIDIRVAVNDFFCYDSVLVIQASPATSGNLPPVIGDLKAWPNPFRTSIRFEFNSRQPGPVDLIVYDLQGRTVRDLMPGRWFPGGTFSVSWDGLTGSGTEAPPGMYFVRLRGDGRRSSSPVVLVR